MQNLKINNNQENIDLTSIVLERQVIKEMVSQHGALWFIAYELFVLNNSMSMSEFKRMFLGCVIGLPVFIAACYGGLVILSKFGGAN